ncbi:hypothetical protein COL922a_001739 [Colletotrichum nupharicola]|nr:hypothetical protein COL922a_001739 [Colletotrichum nupharicola]
MAGAQRQSETVETMRAVVFRHRHDPLLQTREGRTLQLVLSDTWLAESTDVNKWYPSLEYYWCCAGMAYAKTEEMLDRIAYSEDPFAPSDVGFCHSVCLDYTCSRGSGAAAMAQAQRLAIREHYVIKGSEKLDRHAAGSERTRTININHQEVTMREKLCRELDKHPFPKPPMGSPRRFKPVMTPYIPPPPMEMPGLRSLPVISESPETSIPRVIRRNPLNSPPVRHRTPSVISIVEELLEDPKENNCLRDNRQDTPARSPDVLRSPVLGSQDPNVVVDKPSASHRLARDPIAPAGLNPLFHSVHDDPVLGTAQEVRLHTIHEDPVTQMARQPEAHRINQDPKAKVAAAASPHSVHEDPAIKVAAAAPPHSVHEDPAVKVADYGYDHRLSHDAVVASEPPTKPHTVHDDETVAMPRAYQPAPHRLSSDLQVAGRGPIVPHSVHDDPTVKVSQGDPRNHTMPNDSDVRKGNENSPMP